MPAAQMSPARIKVSGLSEFRQAVRRAELRMPSELTKALREVGNDMKRGIRRRIDRTLVLPRSERTGRLREDLHVSTHDNEMQVSFGARTEYAGWWEFGGNKRTPPPPRERVASGRTLYPTLKEQRPEIDLKFDLLLTKLGIEIETRPPTGAHG